MRVSLTSVKHTVAYQYLYYTSSYLTGVFHPAYKFMVYGNHAIKEKEDFISLIKEAQDKIDTIDGNGEGCS